jgi:hypothetical protein
MKVAHVAGVGHVGHVGDVDHVAQFICLHARQEHIDGHILSEGQRPLIYFRHTYSVIRY